MLFRPVLVRHVVYFYRDSVCVVIGRFNYNIVILK